MVTGIFKSKTNIIILILWIVGFFHFNLLPDFLTNYNDNILFMVVSLIIVSSFLEKTTTLPEGEFGRSINRAMLLLLVFAVINCFVCNYYRHQPVYKTFIQWTPIFFVYFYYPFRKLKINTDDWERIIYILFCIVIVIEIVMLLFPHLLLFRMTSGTEKFENELRVRVFADGILILGNTMCLNKALVGEKRIKYGFLYIFSLFLIFMTGFRMLDVACVIVFFYLLYKLKLLRIKQLLITTIIMVVSLFGLLQIPTVKDRIEEMTERNEVDNFSNDDYVRVLLFNYYTTEYFKSNIEFFLGSGMVQRIVVTDENIRTTKGTDYPSQYSKEVSFMSSVFHYFPVDMGLIGLSWEAGIPAVLTILFVLFYMVRKKTPPQYYYISAWALFLILISWNNPKVYHHHNMIYLPIVLVILEKVMCKESESPKVEMNDRNN